MTKYSATKIVFITTLTFYVIASHASGLFSKAEFHDGEPMSSVVVESDNLHELSLMSSLNNVPLVLIFSAKSCEYCELLEREILAPIVKSGEYDRRAIIRKVMIDRVQPIVNFEGQYIDAEKLADQRGVEVTPTVQIVNFRGKQLTPPIVGYRISDMYEAYFEQAVDLAMEMINQSPTKKAE